MLIPRDLTNIAKIFIRNSGVFFGVHNLRKNVAQYVKNVNLLNIYTFIQIYILIFLTNRYIIYPYIHTYIHT